jgi:phosphocarrier protein
MPDVIERELTIGNRLGLHARASARLVQVLASYRSNATLTAKGREVNAKSIMGVMLLAAGPGTSVLLRVDGVDETSAAAAVVDMFERKIDEDA